MGVATRLRSRSRERRIAQLEDELALADERISRIHAAETVGELRRATTLLPRPRRFPRVAIAAAAGAVVVAAAIAISLAAGHSPSRPTGPAPTPAQAAGPEDSSVADSNLSDYNGVSILLPAGWANWEMDERGWSYVVTRDHRVQARIEVTPDVRTHDPAVLANRARRVARRRPGYHEIRFRRETMNGEDAVRFDYLMREDGTKLRFESVFFVDSYGRGIGFFERVPAVSYHAWSVVFQHMRNSLSINPASMNMPVGPAAPHG
jgi:hypothetical protein